MTIKEEMHKKVREFDCKGGGWKDLNLVTKLHITMLCELIEERLPAITTESASTGDALSESKLKAIENLTKMYRESLAEIVRP